MKTKIIFLLALCLVASPLAAEEIPVISHNPEVSALLNEAAEARSSGDANQAIQRYKKAASIEPENFFLHRNLGILYFETGDYKSATESLIRASRLRIDDAYTLLYLGNAVYKIDGAQEALPYLEAAKDKQDDVPEIHNALGDVYLQLNRQTESETAYKRAIELNPDNPSSYEGLGRLYFQRKLYRLALQNFQEALGWDRKNADLWFNAGMCYYHLNNLDKAAEALHRSLTYKPNDAESFNALGLVFQKAGHWKLAEKSFKKAVEIKPSYQEARKNLQDLPWRKQEQDVHTFTSNGQRYTSKTTGVGPLKITTTTAGRPRSSGPRKYAYDNKRPGYDPVSGYDPRTGHSDPHAGDSFDSLASIGNSLFGKLFKKD
jgi:tetratricopeptide (TPR) repeat protein